MSQLHQIQQSASPPALILNDHCHICEFRQRCHAQAVDENNLSLLRGMTEQQMAKLNAKGIFTVNQLSYTFRMRRKPKRARDVSFSHDFALQTMAIREKRVFVHRTPALSCSATRVYIDIEGIPQTQSYYLIGTITVHNGVETYKSYWADAENDAVIFQRLLDHLGEYPDYSLIHFGSYETTALRRLTRDLPDLYRGAVDEAAKRSIDMLPMIRRHLYFPTYSNSLKDIGRYLGCSWSGPSSSGIQSLVWRYRWLEDRDSKWKQSLITYNLEDCAALKRVTEFVERAVVGRELSLQSSGIIPTDTLIDPEDRWHPFGKRKFALPEFETINRFAYFDYQRDRVSARTNKVVKRAIAAKAKRRRQKENKLIE